MRRLGQRHDSGPDAAKEACAGRATAMRRVRQSSPDDAGATGCGRTGARVRTASTAVATARVDAVDLLGRLRAREPRILRAQERRRLPPSSPLATKPAAEADRPECARVATPARRFETVGRRHPFSARALRRASAANLHCQHCCRAALAAGGCHTQQCGSQTSPVLHRAPRRRALARRRVFLSRDANCAASRTGSETEITTRSASQAVSLRRRRGARSWGRKAAARFFLTHVLRRESLNAITEPPCKAGKNSAGSDARSA